MYEEPKETEYEPGLAVANQAIGDAYTIANQCDKALDSYQDALKELNHLSQQHPYRIQLLLKISNALQRKGQLEKAQKTLHDIEQTLQKQPDYATCFFANIEEANNAISHGHLSKAYLKEAAAYLPPALVAAMRGTVQDSENRIARLLFKLAVEVNMMMNVLAAGMEISDEDLKTLRARSVREVKQTNGRISFKDAIDYQRGVE